MKSEELKYEEKFIVTNKKHLKEIPDKAALNAFVKALSKISPWLPRNKYYVCNQDEPYADKVLDIIFNRTSAPAERCEWKLEDPDCDMWKSSCGIEWNFIASGPKENGVKFCVNCGKPVLLPPAEGKGEE